MKPRRQKRKEAADRLDRYAGEIERGERMGAFMTPEDRKAHAEKRRSEATRLRAIQR